MGFNSGFKGLSIVKEERNILQIIWRGKSKWIGHIKIRNCRPNYVIGGKIEIRFDVTVKRGRRSKQTLGYFRVIRGCYKLKQEALDRTLWRTRFGRGIGPVVRQRTEGIVLTSWIRFFKIIRLYSVGVPSVSFSPVLWLPTSLQNFSFKFCLTL